MRTSAEVEADVEASRNDLDRNVEALKQKMTPGQLFDEAARMMGGTGRQVASKFAEQAKANPMPLAVMGLGLAWLMMSNSQAPSRPGRPGAVAAEPRSFADDFDVEAAYAFGEGESGGPEELKDRARELGDKAHGVVSAVQEKMTSARAAVAGGGRTAGHALSSGVHSVRQGASHAGRRAQQTFLDTLEGEPLLLAGAGLLVGVAIGAALPATEVEDRMLGETRDRLLERGKSLAQSGVEKAGAAAQATYGAVKAELQEQDPERAPADRLADAARSGVQAAQERLQNPPH